jgi:hypothetical protein
VFLSCWFAACRSSSPCTSISIKSNISNRLHSWAFLVPLASVPYSTSRSAENSYGKSQSTAKCERTHR